MTDMKTRHSEDSELTVIMTVPQIEARNVEATLL